MKTPYEVDATNAPKIALWLRDRGGILVWRSQDLSNPSASCTTPAITDGQPTAPPHWRYTGCKPLHITDAADVTVYVPKVVERFAVKLKARGMKLVLTDGSTRKVRQAVERHGETAFHRFASTGTAEGSTPHALTTGGDDVEICVNDSTQPLTEWLKSNPIPDANQPT